MALREKNEGVDPSAQDTRGYTDFEALLRGDFAEPDVDVVLPLKPTLLWDFKGHRRWQVQQPDDSDPPPFGNSSSSTAPPSPSQSLPSSPNQGSVVNQVRVVRLPTGFTRAFSKDNLLTPGSYSPKLSPVKFFKCPGSRFPPCEPFAVDTMDGERREIAVKIVRRTRALLGLMSAAVATTPLEKRAAQREVIESKLGEEDKSMIHLVEADGLRLLHYSNQEVLERIVTRERIKDHVRTIAHLQKESTQQLERLDQRLKIQVRHTNSLLNITTGGTGSEELGGRVLTTQLKQREMAAFAALGSYHIGHFGRFQLFKNRMRHRKDEQREARIQGSQCMKRKKTKHLKMLLEEGFDDSDLFGLDEDEIYSTPGSPISAKESPKNKTVVNKGLRSVIKQKFQDVDAMLQVSSSFSSSSDATDRQRKRDLRVTDIIVKSGGINPGIERLVNFVENGQAATRVQGNDLKKMEGKLAANEEELVEALQCDCQKEVDTMVESDEVSDDVIAEVANEDAMAETMKAHLETRRYQQERLKAAARDLERQLVDAWPPAKTTLQQVGAEGGLDLNSLVRKATEGLVKNPIASAQGPFNASVTFDPAENIGDLGFSADVVVDGSVLVKSINEKGPIAKWNVDNPSETIRVGDTLRGTLADVYTESIAGPISAQSMNLLVNDGTVTVERDYLANLEQKLRPPPPSSQTTSTTQPTPSYVSQQQDIRATPEHSALQPPTEDPVTGEDGQAKKTGSRESGRQGTIIRKPKQKKNRGKNNQAERKFAREIAKLAHQLGNASEALKKQIEEIDDRCKDRSPEMMAECTSVIEILEQGIMQDLRKALASVSAPMFDSLQQRGTEADGIVDKSIETLKELRLDLEDFRDSDYTPSQNLTSAPTSPTIGTGFGFSPTEVSGAFGEATLDVGVGSSASSASGTVDLAIFAVLLPSAVGLDPNACAPNEVQQLAQKHDVDDELDTAALASLEADRAHAETLRFEFQELQREAGSRGISNPFSSTATQAQAPETETGGHHHIDKTKHGNSFNETSSCQKPMAGLIKATRSMETISNKIDMNDLFEPPWEKLQQKKAALAKEKAAANTASETLHQIKTILLSSTDSSQIAKDIMTELDAIANGDTYIREYILNACEASPSTDISAEHKDNGAGVDPLLELMQEALESNMCGVSTLQASKYRQKLLHQTDKKIQSMKKNVAQKQKVLYSMLPKEEGDKLRRKQMNRSDTGMKRTNTFKGPEGEESKTAKEETALQLKLKNLDKLTKFWAKRIETAKDTKEKQDQAAPLEDLMQVDGQQPQKQVDGQQPQKPEEEIGGPHARDSVLVNPERRRRSTKLRRGPTTRRGVRGSLANDIGIDAKSTRFGSLATKSRQSDHDESNLAPLLIGGMSAAKFGGLGSNLLIVNAAAKAKGRGVPGGHPGSHGGRAGDGEPDSTVEGFVRDILSIAQVPAQHDSRIYAVAIMLRPKEIAIVREEFRIMMDQEEKSALMALAALAKGQIYKGSPLLRAPAAHRAPKVFGVAVAIARRLVRHIGGSQAPDSMTSQSSNEMQVTCTMTPPSDRSDGSEDRRARELRSREKYGTPGRGSGDSSPARKPEVNEELPLWLMQMMDQQSIENEADPAKRRSSIQIMSQLLRSNSHQRFPKPGASHDVDNYKVLDTRAKRIEDEDKETVEELNKLREAMKRGKADVMDFRQQGRSWRRAKLYKEMSQTQNATSEFLVKRAQMLRKKRRMTRDLEENAGRGRRALDYIWDIPDGVDDTSHLFHAEVDSNKALENWIRDQVGIRKKTRFLDEEQLRPLVEVETVGVPTRRGGLRRNEPRTAIEDRVPNFLAEDPGLLISATNSNGGKNEADSRRLRRSSGEKRVAIADVGDFMGSQVSMDVAGFLTMTMTPSRSRDTSENARTTPTPKNGRSMQTSVAGDQRGVLEAKSMSVERRDKERSAMLSSSSSSLLASIPPIDEEVENIFSMLSSSIKRRNAIFGSSIRRIFEDSDSDDDSPKQEMQKNNNKINNNLRVIELDIEGKKSSKDFDRIPIKMAKGKLHGKATYTDDWTDDPEVALDVISFRNLRKQLSVRKSLGETRGTSSIKLSELGLPEMQLEVDGARLIRAAAKNIFRKRTETGLEGNQKNQSKVELLEGISGETDEENYIPAVEGNEEMDPVVDWRNWLRQNLMLFNRPEFPKDRSRQTDLSFNPPPITQQATDDSSPIGLFEKSMLTKLANLDLPSSRPPKRPSSSVSLTSRVRHCLLAADASQTPPNRNTPSAQSQKRPREEALSQKRPREEALSQKRPKEEEVLSPFPNVVNHPSDQKSFLLLPKGNKLGDQVTRPNRAPSPSRLNSPLPRDVTFGGTQTSRLNSPLSPNVTVGSIPMEARANQFMNWPTNFDQYLEEFSINGLDVALELTKPQGSREESSEEKSGKLWTPKTVPAPIHPHVESLVPEKLHSSLCPVGQVDRRVERFAAEPGLVAAPTDAFSSAVLGQPTPRQTSDEVPTTSTPQATPSAGIANEAGAGKCIENSKGPTISIPTLAAVLGSSSSEVLLKSSFTRLPQIDLKKNWNTDGIKDSISRNPRTIRDRANFRSWAAHIQSRLPSSEISSTARWKNHVA